MNRQKRGRGRRRLRWLVIILALAAAVWAGWGAFYLGPLPELELTLERPAIGVETKVYLTAREAARGLSRVELRLVQGDNEAELGLFEAQPASVWKPWTRGTEQASLAGIAGRAEQDWLEEGDAVIRAVASRLSGPLRGAADVVIERPVVVRLRPPALSVLSGPLWIKQGGSGAIVFRPGDTAVKSGVRAGGAEFRSYALPGGAAGERFVLFGAPWDLAEDSEIVLFAEDDAGNRAVKRAPDGFKAAPPRRDTIRLGDGFLDRVVPAIISQSPGVDAGGTLIEQYLRINGDLRRQNRAFIAELARESEEAFLWSGPFLQLPGSARKANFAEVRRYLYGGGQVDEQVHLGLDLASVARAPIPASNGGVVRFAGYLGIYGNAVVLDHGFGLTSVHAHMSSIAVEPGQRVGRGEVLGTTGATGLAGGDHLHLGLFIQGVAVDPIEWLDGKWIRDHLADRLPLAAPDS